MKNPLIKICGITSEEEIRYIAKAGIDYAGFVLFFPKSKRNLSLECAKKLIAKLPAGVVSVAVTVSPTKEQVEAVVEAGFLAIQIHGKIEDSVITSCRIPVFKAFNVSDMDAFSHYEEMDEVAGFVMDAAVPGSGKTFDWDLLQKLLFVLYSFCYHLCALHRNWCPHHQFSPRRQPEPLPHCPD